MSLKKKERKKFISIDWDFFVDATEDEKLWMFPECGNEYLSYAVQQIIWGNKYVYPELVEIGVREPEYSTLKTLISEFVDNWIMNDEFKPIMCMIGESHLHMYDMVMKNTTPNEYFEVYNIDHHHDRFTQPTSSSITLNCGNWVNELQKQRPHMKYYWIKNEDSNTKVNGEEVEYKPCNIEDLLDQDFYGLFFCRSALWSPPHLDNHFIKSWEPVKENLSYMMERYIDQPREYAPYVKTYEDSVNEVIKGVI
jgi:hypothetical protein